MAQRRKVAPPPPLASQIESKPSILRRRQVEARTGLSRSTIYLRVAGGTFPPPVNLGSRAVGWLDSEISDWVASRVAASREATE